MAADLDDYLSSLDEPARAALEHVRRIAIDLAPDAEQEVSYGMAALRYRGKPLLGFLAAKDHLSIFPFGSSAIDAVRDRLDGYSLSKGTVRFTVAKPLPDDVVRDIVRHRMNQITSP